MYTKPLRRLPRICFWAMKLKSGISGAFQTEKLWSYIPFKMDFRAKFLSKFPISMIGGNKLTISSVVQTFCSFICENHLTTLVKKNSCRKSRYIPMIFDTLILHRFINVRLQLLGLFFKHDNKFLRFFALLVIVSVSMIDFS